MVLGTDRYYIRTTPSCVDDSVCWYGVPMCVQTYTRYYHSHWWFGRDNGDL